MAAAALLPLLAMAFVTPAVASDAAHPTVVELYQSQGCSSCPPAIQNLNVISQRPEILALTFAVTYWDQLGWKDTFAKPEFTERQRDYDQVARLGQVATPQTIVNGRATTNGGNGRQLLETIRTADRGVSGPAIASAAGKITIGAAKATQPATIWLIRYDPRPLSVPIRAGENGGRTLVHRNVVLSLAAVGSWRGSAITIPAPSTDPNLQTAVLVQSGKGGAIIAAARL
ncbi:DUF1223 domain-containing protein [Sphingomonas glacialis]|uniref:DUF1223 domain-containing protein n=2 Tax=Sphingomonas glacialis TaxID=658225 RepID=A0A502FSP9_9SPHN|nr:DUF1223 domain-containing protein [Sphingomonas glacialis]